MAVVPAAETRAQADTAVRLTPASLLKWPPGAEKAEERKREQSILYERQLAKERAAEDHLFGDKERFVTAAYRKKLEEDRKWLEEEKKK
jgi:hypothetical protein